MDNPIFKLLSAAWSVFGLVGLIVAASAICSFLLFRTYGAKWLDGHFERRLENYKNAQEQEMERLKFRINALIDRATKIHEKEFEFLPQVWLKLVEACDECNRLAALIKQYPNFGSVTNDRIEKFLEDEGLSQFQKADFWSSADKLKFWIDLTNSRNLRSASEAHGRLTSEMMRYSIFFNEDIKNSFTNYARILIEVIQEFSIYEIEGERPQVRTARRYFLAEGERELKALESIVRDRLWNAEKPVF